MSSHPGQVLCPPKVTPRSKLDSSSFPARYGKAAPGDRTMVCIWPGPYSLLIIEALKVTVCGRACPQLPCPSFCPAGFSVGSRTGAPGLEEPRG